MTEKSLANKAVDIKGKQYVLVADRVLYFNEHYPDGSITTQLVSDPDATRVIVKATIDCPSEKGAARRFTGYSQAIVGEGMVNKTAALENAETSAVGRALAFMGIGVIESIASADEVHKATVAPYKPAGATRPAKPKDEPKDANIGLKMQIARLLKERHHFTSSDKTKKEVENKIFELTDLMLNEDNYQEIISRLSAE